MMIDYTQPNIYMDITDDPTFEVHIPVSQGIIWPNNCSLCTSPIVEKKKSIAHNIQSGEYLIAETYRRYTLNDIPYCNKCYNKTILSISEKYSIIISIIIGAIIASLIIIFHLFSSLFNILRFHFFCPEIVCFN